MEGLTEIMTYCYPKTDRGTGRRLEACIRAMQFAKKGCSVPVGVGDIELSFSLMCGLLTWNIGEKLRGEIEEYLYQEGIK